MIRQRVRIRFRKHGDLRLIGHRDLVRSMERLFRRAELNLSMTEGFHPKPRMIFPLALALGIRGDDEIMELELTEIPDCEALLDRLNRFAPPGLTFDSVELRPEGTKKAQVTSVTLQLSIPSSRCADVQAKIADILQSSSWLINRAKKKKSLDLREAIQELQLIDAVLIAKLRITPEASVRPVELLEALGLEDLSEQGFPIVRSRVEVADEESR